MDLTDAIKKRHAVREYKDEPIDEKTVKKLQEYIDSVNEESGLNIQLVLNEPEAFNEEHLAYGRIHGAKNYLAIVGKDEADFEEKSGYFGEKLVLIAQELGLNTCWVGSTYKKMQKLINMRQGDRFLLIIAIGYGKDEGVPHESKPADSVMQTDEEAPEWFLNGVEAALLAPTAMNQQKFKFILKDKNKVEAKTYRAYFCKTDLGIAKYHFEMGAGKENFEWVNTI